MATRDPNEGARLLRLRMELEQLTHDDVEAVIKRSDGTVSRYLSGHKKPGRETAAIIEEKYEVPARSWDEPAARPGRRGKTSTARQGVSSTLSRVKRVEI